MNFNVTYSTAVTPSESHAIDQVAAYFQSNFTDNIDINLNISFQDLGNHLITDTFNRDFFTYSAIRNELLSHATTADDATALNSNSGSVTPNDINPNSGGFYYLTHPQERALGLRPGNDPSIDYNITFNTAVGYDFDRSDGITAGTYDFIGLVAYEFSRAMGRQLFRDPTDQVYSLLDLFDFKSTGGHFFSGGASSAYFSIDGGSNHLGDFASSGNLGDWASNFGADAFSTDLFPGLLLPVSQTDLRELDVIGFSRQVDDVGSTNQFFSVLASSPLTSSVSTTGTVNYSGDHDWYQIKLERGFHYNFQLQGSDTSHGTLSDPKLALHDVAGNQIAFDDDSGPGHDSDFYYTAPANMTVFVDAAGFSNGTGTYTLSVHPSSTPQTMGADFDNNLHNDILWRNANGAVSIWNDGDVNAAHFISNPGAVPGGWHIVNTGDFAGDNRTDILWQNDNGAVSIWDNGDINQAHIIANPGAVASSWHIAGTGDFDENGHTDILWRNDNGTLSLWDNGDINQAHFITAPGAIDASWHIEAVTDFRSAEIVWRNDNGNVAFTIGAFQNPVPFINIPTSWHIVGAGDFRGDGTPDLLWQNDNGAVSIWDDFVPGTARIIAQPGDVLAGWHIQSTGDFNGDGTSDILWRNDNGTVSIWDNGDIHKAHILANITADWQVQHQHYDIV